MGKKSVSSMEMAEAVTTAVAMVARATRCEPAHVLERVGPPDGFVQSMVDRQLAENHRQREEAKDHNTCP